MVKVIIGLMVLMLGCTAGATVIFESDGSSLDEWNVQWHQTTGPEAARPVWNTDGSWIRGEAFHSGYLGAYYGGSMVNTNSFSLEVGEVATITMDFQGKGISTPDTLHHWWFSFGFRTGGDEPWQWGKVGASASMRIGVGPGQPNGFDLWNTWYDSWSSPFPRCEFRSDDRYESDVVTITYALERVEDGFGISALTVSNHTTGVRSTATSYARLESRNAAAASNLFMYCEMPARFDGASGHVTAGTHVRLSNIRLEVEKKSAKSFMVAPDIPDSEPEPEAPAPYINSVATIKKLSNLEADTNFPVQLTGQVLSLHPRQTRIFLHDGIAGLYVELEQAAENYDGLKVGSKIRLDGMTMGGGFSPIVYTPNLEVIGWAPLPHARKLDRPLHLSTSVDVDWVAVEGRPVTMEYVKSYNHFMVTMEVLDTTMEVFIPHQPGAYRKMKPYMFQHVLVYGVLGTKANHNQQMTSRILYINSIDDIQLMPGIAGVVPRYFPMSALMQYGKASTGLVKTKGTIISASPDELYLRGDDATLKASIFQEKVFKPGDLVELVGYVHLQPVSPAFRTVSITKTGEAPPPAPLEIQINGAGIDVAWNNELVSLDAEFLYAEKTFMKERIDAFTAERADATKDSLWCRVGSRVFEARLPGGISAPKELRPGSRIRLMGICHVSATKNPRLDEMTDSIWLELIDEDSVNIIRQASWWTAKRLMWVLVGSIMLLQLFLFWVLALQKVVARQTQTIGTQIQREAVLNERQRMAQELHDTVNQGLHALDFQLNRVEKKVNEGSEERQQAVEAAKRILHACQAESRASIQDLRGGILEEMDLPTLIHYTLEPYLEGTEIDFKVRMEGEGKRLKLSAKHQLLRLISEASNNAIQHAAPSTILIKLTYDHERLQVLVEDDGCGFDPDAVGHAGHFGIRGLFERAERLNGTLTVDSQKGAGTKVSLSIPVTEIITESAL